MHTTIHAEFVMRTREILLILGHFTMLPMMILVQTERTCMPVSCLSSKNNLAGDAERLQVLWILGKFYLLVMLGLIDIMMTLFD